MRVFLTGATGFIGGRLAHFLRRRNDDVVVLVRSTDSAKAQALAVAGCELIVGDLSDRAALARGARRADVIVHAAARYAVGIPKSERRSMHETNVVGTRNVLEVAGECRVQRIVYVSTVNVFGDTLGAVADETFERDHRRGFLSVYDETKFRSHLLADQHARSGAPIVTVMPGPAYGPGDHFETGRQLLLAAKGELPILMLADVGLTLSYVDDVADGIIGAIEKGAIGEKYILGGERVRLREVLGRVALLGGHRPPTKEVPARLLKLGAPLAPMLLPLLGYPPNLDELVRAADNVTYWATDEKAQRLLGYSPRPLDEGLRVTLQSAQIPVVG